MQAREIVSHINDNTDALILKKFTDKFSQATWGILLPSQMEEFKEKRECELTKHQVEIVLTTLGFIMDSRASGAPIY
jgi:hypothetical protein